MQPAHHRAPFSNPAQAESVSSRHARFSAPCTRRRVSQEAIAPCRRQAVFLTSLTKKNSRTLSEARTESTRAFPGVKDTLHHPVAEKIVAAEAGQGSPHRRFALTLAGVASTVAAMSPEGAWPPDRGRVSEHSSFDASLRRHSHGPRQRAGSLFAEGDHHPQGRGSQKPWRRLRENSGLLKQSRPLYTGEKAGPGASIRGGERDTPDCLNPTSMLGAWMVGSLP